MLRSTLGPSVLVVKDLSRSLRISITGAFRICVGGFADERKMVSCHVTAAPLPVGVFLRCLLVLTPLPKASLFKWPFGIVIAVWLQMKGMPYVSFEGRSVAGWALSVAFSPFLLPGHRSLHGLVPCADIQVPKLAGTRGGSAC